MTITTFVACGHITERSSWSPNEHCRLKAVNSVGTLQQCLSGPGTRCYRGGPVAGLVPVTSRVSHYRLTSLLCVWPDPQYCQLTSYKDRRRLKSEPLVVVSRCCALQVSNNHPFIPHLTSPGKIYVSLIQRLVYVTINCESCLAGFYLMVRPLQWRLPGWSPFWYLFNGR